jgi:hypothetical protein
MPATAFAQQDSGAVIFSQQELDQILAPIALYPDPLLTQVLIAATYPLEVVQAARFVKQNPSVEGEALAHAVEGQPWDASVKALVQFPAVLAMMDEQLAWTQKLGDAFLAQQGAVMDTVQTLRAKAQAAGTLASNQQQQVLMQDGAIDIEPVAPDVVYVPYYDPTMAYGAWRWPDYPPMVWLPPSRYRQPPHGTRFPGEVGFGIGVTLSASLFNNTHPDWGTHHFVLGHGPARRPDEIWTHNTEHRRGVSYRDLPTRNRFQPQSNDSGNREAFRGHVSGAPAVAPPVVSPTRRPEPVRPAEPRPREPAFPGSRPPVEQTHPFIPSGPASVIQSNVERGRASRQESGAHSDRSHNPSR